MCRCIVQYIEHDQLTVGEVVNLYRSVGWDNYTSDPGGLVQAIERSTFRVTARDDRELVGLARCLSDDFSIFYLQDLLVRPERQQQGVGRALLDTCLRRFDHVRQRVLLTDDDEHQHRLYRSAGYRDVANLRHDRLHAFVGIEGVELT